MDGDTLIAVQDFARRFIQHFGKSRKLIITSQPIFTWRQIIWICIKHPRNLRIIGPDTALFNWQIARKLRWWKQADRVKAKFKELEPELNLALTKERYEVHGRS